MTTDWTQAWIDEVRKELKGKPGLGPPIHVRVDLLQEALDEIERLQKVNAVLRGKVHVTEKFLEAFGEKDGD